MIGCMDMALLSCRKLESLVYTISTILVQICAGRVRGANLPRGPRRTGYSIDRWGNLSIRGGKTVLVSGCYCPDDPKNRIQTKLIFRFRGDVHDAEHKEAAVKYCQAGDTNIDPGHGGSVARCGGTVARAGMRCGALAAAADCRARSGQ